MGRHLFKRGKDWFWLVSRGEGLVLAGFRVGRTGFGWFRAGRTGFGWFRLVPLFSNYHSIWGILVIFPVSAGLVGDQL